ncbi:hypothetical protein GHT06_022289 [Daphnia sinensis]|uniref:HMG box domain-containing protein n=1 Tax=Daphnia sinensis TaxID=1820382 RepID=A0AAD5KGW1_9CRUS|nr:hypothetical protein GHT06_022289 [Daphnia sinensis]
MYAIRIFPRLSNPWRSLNVAFSQPANYATTTPKRTNLEEKLGLPERPKKPASPYLMFVKKTFPEYAKMNPKLPFKEVVQKVSEQWKKVDMETKTKMLNEYHEKLQKHPEEVEKYFSSLTDAQRVQLEAAKQDKNEIKKKRRTMQELKKTGKPIRPVASFGMFVKDEYSKMQSKNTFGPSAIKEISKKWNNLTPEEKAPFKLRYQEAYKAYEKNLVEWEEEMVRQGKESLVRSRSRPAHGEPKKSSLVKGVERDPLKPLINK